MRVAIHLSVHQFQQLFRGQAACGIAAFEQLLSQVTLSLVKLDDLFFDRAQGDKPVDGYWPKLTDAMRAIGRLIFYGQRPLSSNRCRLPSG